MNKRQSLCGGIVAIIILALAIIVPLFTPLITGEDTGERLTESLDSIIQREYEVEEEDGYYYDSEGNEIYDQEYIEKYKKEDEKLNREYRKIEKYGDDLSVFEEISYLSSLVEHSNELREGNLSDYTWILIMTIAIIVFIALMVIYSIIMLILTIINLTRKNMYLHKATVRVRNLLFFIVPLLLVIVFQNYIFSRGVYSIGIGLIAVLVCVLITIVLLVLSESMEHDNKKDGNSIAIAMILATIMALIMNFAPGIKSYGIGIPVGSLEFFGNYETMSIKEKIELEEDEKDEDEYYEDDSYIDTLEEEVEAFENQIIAGILVLVAVVITILMLSSMCNSISKKRKIYAYPFIAIVNIILYLLAINYLKDEIKIFKKIEDAIEIGYGMIALIAINISILIFEVYRIIMNRNANKVAQIPEQSNQVWQYMPQQETPIWNSQPQQETPIWNTTSESE